MELVCLTLVLIQLVQLEIIALKEIAIVLIHVLEYLALLMKNVLKDNVSINVLELTVHMGKFVQLDNVLQLILVPLLDVYQGISVIMEIVLINALQ